MTLHQKDSSMSHQSSGLINNHSFFQNYNSSTSSIWAIGEIPEINAIWPSRVFSSWTNAVSDATSPELPRRLIVTTIDRRSFSLRRSCFQQALDSGHVRHFRVCAVQISADPLNDSPSQQLRFHCKETHGRRKARILGEYLAAARECLVFFVVTVKVQISYIFWSSTFIVEKFEKIIKKLKQYQSQLCQTWGN